MSKFYDRLLAEKQYEKKQGWTEREQKEIGRIGGMLVPGRYKRPLNVEQKIMTYSQSMEAR